MPLRMVMDGAETALVELLHMLDTLGYSFVTPTRETIHRGRIGRALANRATLDDLFGWNRAIRIDAIPPEIVALMRRGGIARLVGFGRLRSRWRVARLSGQLLYHGGFAMCGSDAVFLGPDSYRFAAFLGDAIGLIPQGARLVDLGCGAGAGVIAAAALRPDLLPVLADIDPAALRLARINLAAAGLSGEFVESDGLTRVAGPIDAVIANPPFLGGRIGPRYRNGGGALGAAVSLAWLRSAMARLSPRGVLLMYTAGAIVDGHDPLRAAVEEEMREAGYRGVYREVDPDIFGGMLWRPSYRGVDRIAAVTLSARRVRQGEAGGWA